MLHGHHFIREICRGPETNFGLRDILIDKGEDTGRVGDIADVHDLPRRAQEYAWPATDGSLWDSGAKR